MKTHGGRVQAYIGNGKGKTTAAFGLALRALGHGYTVGILQFFKKGDFGEVKALCEIYPEYKLFLRQFGSGQFVNPRNPSVNDILAVEQGFALAREMIAQEQFNLIVLDEVLDALAWQMIAENDLINLLESRPDRVELVMTGRELPPRLALRTHLISRVDNLKHPFADGLPAREGVEY